MSIIEASSRSSIEASSRSSIEASSRSSIERTIHRASIESIEQHRASSRSSTTLGPLSLLLALLLALPALTLGGSPDVFAAGTGSQGQISDSLGSDRGVYKQVDKGVDKGGHWVDIATPPLTCGNAVKVHLCPPSYTPPALFVHTRPGGYVVDPTGRRVVDVDVVSTKISLNLKEALRGSW